MTCSNPAAIALVMTPNRSRPRAAPIAATSPEPVQALAPTPYPAWAMPMQPAAPAFAAPPDARHVLRIRAHPFAHRLDPVVVGDPGIGAGEAPRRDPPHRHAAPVDAGRAGVFAGHFLEQRSNPFLQGMLPRQIRVQLES